MSLTLLKADSIGLDSSLWSQPLASMLMPTWRHCQCVPSDQVVLLVSLTLLKVDIIGLDSSLWSQPLASMLMPTWRHCQSVPSDQVVLLVLKGYCQSL